MIVVHGDSFHLENSRRKCQTLKCLAQLCKQNCYVQRLISISCQKMKSPFDFISRSCICQCRKPFFHFSLQRVIKTKRHEFRTIASETKLPQYFTILRLVRFEVLRCTFKCVIASLCLNLK